MLSCIISIITRLQQLQWPNIGLSKKRLPPNWLVHHDFPFEHDHVFQVYRTPMFRRSLSHQKSPGPCCATEIHRPHPSLPSSAAGARPASKMLSSWDAKIWTKNWAFEPRWLFNQECGRSIFRHTMDVGPVLNVLIYPKLSGQSQTWSNSTSPGVAQTHSLFNPHPLLQLQLPTNRH